MIRLNDFMLISQRLDKIQAPVIPLVGEMIAANPGTISLGQGIVHYDPPSSIVEAVSSRLSEQQSHRYGLVSGHSELISQLKEKCEKENGISIDESRRIIVTAGSNMAFQSTVLAIADPGDEIIILSPYYFNHEMAIGIANCKAVVVPTDHSYQPDIAAIEAAMSTRTRAIVTISPNNPTGAVYSRDSLTAINQMCRDKGIYHICDEAYEYFVYGKSKHFSAASLPGSNEWTISLFSLSKAYGMAGWRVGYMVIPKHLEMSIKKIQDTNLICPTMLSQFAAISALKEGRIWCDKQMQGFDAVRQLVLSELSSLGEKITVPKPEGAFYVFFKLANPHDDMLLVRQLIEEYKVAVMPGRTFGVGDGTYLRIAYGALSQASVAEGMSRLIQGLERLL